MIHDNSESPHEDFDRPPLIRDAKLLTKAVISSAISLPTISSTLMLIGAVVIVLLRDGQFDSWLPVMFVLTWLIPISLFFSCDMYIGWRNWWGGQITNSGFDRLRDLCLKSVMLPCCVTCVVFYLGFEEPFRTIVLILLALIIYLAYVVWPH